MPSAAEAAAQAAEDAAAIERARILCRPERREEVEAYRRSLQDRGIVFRPPSPGHQPVDNDYLTSAIVRVQRGQQLVATRLQIYNECSRLRDVHRELETFEPRLGWAFVAEEEKKRDALPNRRWQRKREIQEVIDASIQAVEEEYGPRMELAPDETVASLKAKRARLGEHIQAQERRLATEHGQRNFTLTRVLAEINVAGHKLGEAEDDLAHCWLKDVRQQLKVSNQEISRLRGEAPALAGLPAERLQQLRDESLEAFNKIDAAARRAVQDETECVVCRDARRSFIFLPCGHLAACEECAAEQDRCPLCRVEATSKQRVFWG